MEDTADVASQQVAVKRKLNAAKADTMNALAALLKAQADADDPNASGTAEGLVLATQALASEWRSAKAKEDAATAHLLGLKVPLHMAHVHVCTASTVGKAALIRLCAGYS